MNRPLGTEEPSDKLPKIIWMMWLQGLDNAPEVVQACYRSWVELNPGWQVIFLDETSVHDYVEVKHIFAAGNNMQIQAHSDVIRIHLLARHGGVWVDATCLCRKSLDTWLPEATRSGFFAFSRPSKIKLMDNWFMAAHRDCYLTQKLREEADAYWLSNTGLTRHRNTWLSKTLKLFLDNSVATTRYWFSYPVRKFAKAYPYAWFQFLFSKLVAEDARFRKIWDDAPKISADLPHRVQHLGMLEPLTETSKNEIDNDVSPLYKLTWKYRTDKNTENSLLAYLLQSARRDPLA